jgi:hypothetical protein
MEKMKYKKFTCPVGIQKISISATLRKRGITEEEIIRLESLGQLKKHGICKSAEGRYIQYIWYRDTDLQKN